LENAVQLRPVTVLLVALAAVGGPLAGCGGSDSSPSSSPSAGSPQPANSSQPSPSAASNGSGSLSIADFTFKPASLTAEHGTAITVTNNDSTAHTVTADDGHSFDTGDVDPGSSATLKPLKAGTYKYHCSIHSFMHGTLVVR
jgi:plastocyanin